MAISLPTHRPAAGAASVSTRGASTPQDMGREGGAGHATELQEPPQATVPEADSAQPAMKLPPPIPLTQEETGATVPVADVPGAIPQSSAAPVGMLHHLDADELRRRAAEERNVLDWARWRADSHARIFRVVLGDARSRAGVDVSFAGDDVEGGWRTVAVDAYLRSFIHGAPLPTGPLARDLLRYKVSIVMFDGRGGDSDEAFHAELVKAAATYKKNVDLAGDGTQRSDRAAKLRRLYGPEAAGEGEEALSGVESLARKAHVFIPRSFTGMAADYFNLDEQTPAERTAMYQRYRDAMAEEYGLTTAELEDVLRHRMDAQEHAVSRDALGQVHIKNELMIRGVGEISTAIQRSDLTPEEKELLLADLPARFARFKEGVIANVMEQMPEFAREFGIRSVADFNSLVSALHEGRAMQAAGGAAVGLGKTAASLEYIGGLFEEKVRLGGLLGKSYLKERSEEMDRRVMVNEQINALSHEFNRAKTTLFGVDAAAIGQGVYSVVETAALAALTGPLAPEIAAVRYGRAAMMFNSASKVAPVAAFMAGRQASATYDDAIRRNFSTDQAEDLALKAGSIGFLTTVLFSAAGAGGVEGIASGAARQALRESLRGTARNALRESLMAGGKGMLGEMAEEQIITALDAALVQAELRPGMTAEDFQRAVYETAVVTFIGSGGFAVAHGKHAYDDTLAGNARIATETTAEGDGALAAIGEVDAGGAGGGTAIPARPKVEITTEQEMQVKEAYYQKALSSRIANTDDVRSLIPGYNEADPLTRDADYHKIASAINHGTIDRLLAETPNGEPVIVLAGGPGSGKTTASGIDSKGFPMDFAVDTVMGWDGAMEDLTNRIEKTGREADFYYVFTPFGHSLPRVIDRFIDKDGDSRLVPLAAVVDGHINAQQNILNASDEFEVRIIDNSRGKGEQRIIDKTELKKYDYFREPGREEGSPQDEGRPDRANDDRQHQPSSGGEGTEGARERARARLLAQGREILQRYQQEGKLTQREVDAFLQEGEFAPGTTGSPPPGIPTGNTAKADEQITPEEIEKEQEQLPNGDSSRDAAPGEDFFDDMDDDGTVLHERRAKYRKRETDGRRKDMAEAKGILANVRKLASNWMTNEQHEQQPRRKMLFAAKVTTTPEERMILKSRYEIMLVYSREGRLKSAHGGSREQSKKPLFSPGDILSHNHPGGRGPSDTDLKVALDHPEITLRIVAKNENGATEIFQIRAKKAVSEAEIEEIAEIYKGLCDDEGDNHAARRKALHLIHELYSAILEISSTTL